MPLNIFKLFNKNNAGSSSDSEVMSTKSSGAFGDKSPAQVLAEGMVNVRDIISPSSIEVDFDHVKVGNTYYRTIFVSGYPRFVGANWLSPIINFDHSLDISMFYYPVKSKMILEDLRRKITELEATTMSNREKGKVTDPVVSTALDDAKALQEQLVKGVEKYFQFSFYITIPATTLDELQNVTSKLESTLGSLLLISKSATLQMEEAFQSSIPAGMDKLMITRNMDTTSLATTFPFTSSDLTMEEGIMYGINRHNGSLVIFDRFSMENANTVVFAKSGAGKSYFVKLEALRLLIFGAQVMIIDPEEEYRALCNAVGGDFIDFSANSPAVINPFDLSGVAVEGENELGIKILSLMTLFKLMLGGVTQTEEAILDRALMETYRIKGISTDPETQMNKEPPVMEDLYKVLLGADEPEARSMAERLEKFIKGSMAGIFDKQSTISIDNKMTVFSTKNLEDSLRPIAFYIILDFVWTRIRRDLKKRVLIVEEAWYLMNNEDSAKFLYGIAKRARKYYLGLTTITQDVDDFLSSDHGKAIVSNSSIHVLFKQHPSAIERIADVFYLSEGEKRLLLAGGLGEGLFFAGSNHVSIKVMASPEEHKLITTNPEEIIRMRDDEKRKVEQRRQAEERNKIINEQLRTGNFVPPSMQQMPEMPQMNQAPQPSQVPQTAQTGVVVGGGINEAVLPQNTQMPSLNMDKIFDAIPGEKEAPSEQPQQAQQTQTMSPTQQEATEGPSFNDILKSVQESISQQQGGSAEIPAQAPSVFQRNVGQQRSYPTQPEASEAPVRQSTVRDLSMDLPVQPAQPKSYTSNTPPGQVETQADAKGVFGLQNPFKKNDISIPKIDPVEERNQLQSEVGNSPGPLTSN